MATLPFPSHAMRLKVMKSDAIRVADGRKTRKISLSANISLPVVVRNLEKLCLANLLVLDKLTHYLF